MTVEFHSSVQIEELLTTIDSVLVGFILMQSDSCNPSSKTQTTDLFIVDFTVGCFKASRELIAQGLGKHILLVGGRPGTDSCAIFIY